MSQNYYSESDNYPSIILPILERVQYFICKELLYPDITYANPHPRFLLSEQTDDAFRIAAKSFRATNFTLPFTTYVYGDLLVDEERLNVNAKLGLYYADGYSSQVDSTSSIFTIPMMSAFNNVSDFYRAWTILNNASTDNSKILVPCTVNDVSTSFYILMKMDIAKGPYAAELQDQRRIGKVNTIQHDISVYFHNPILDTGIYPVDDIEITLESYTNSDYRDSIFVGSGLVSTTPSVSTTSPVSGAIDVSVDSNMVINFNVPMNEDSVDANIFVDPLFLFETTWNDASTSVIIDPHDNLSSGIAYTVTVYEESVSGEGVEMEEDFPFTFWTES